MCCMQSDSDEEGPASTSSVDHEFNASKQGLCAWAAVHGLTSIPGQWGARHGSIALLTLIVSSVSTYLVPVWLQRCVLLRSAF